MDTNTFNTSLQVPLDTTFDGIQHYAVEFRFCYFNDGLGRFFLFFLFLPELIVYSMIGVTFWMKRRWQITCLLGVLFNFLVNRLLKYSFKNTEMGPRPFLECAADGLGMPSHETQFIWFFATYMALAFFEHDHDGKLEWGEVAKNAYHDALFLGIAILVSISVVSTGYHTVPQAITGCFIGIALAFFYMFNVGIYISIFQGDMVLFQRESSLVKVPVFGQGRSSFVEYLKEVVEASYKNFFDIYVDLLAYGAGYLDRKVLLGAKKHTQRSSTSTIEAMEGIEEYKYLLKACMRDGVIDDGDRRDLHQLRQQYVTFTSQLWPVSCGRFSINDGLHKWVLQRLGYTVQEFAEAMDRPNPEDDKRRLRSQVAQLKQAIHSAKQEVKEKKLVLDEKGQGQLFIAQMKKLSLKGRLSETFSKGGGVSSGKESPDPLSLTDTKTQP